LKDDLKNRNNKI